MSPHRQFTPRKLKEHPAVAIVVRELWEQFEPTLDSRVDRKSQRQTLRELIVDFAALRLHDEAIRPSYFSNAASSVKLVCIPVAVPATCVPSPGQCYTARMPAITVE